MRLHRVTWQLKHMRFPWERVRFWVFNWVGSSTFLNSSKSCLSHSILERVILHLWRRVSNATCLLALAHLYVKEAPVRHASSIPENYVVLTDNALIIRFMEGFSLKTRILICGWSDLWNRKGVARAWARSASRAVVSAVPCFIVNGSESAKTRGSILFVGVFCRSSREHPFSMSVKHENGKRKHGFIRLWAVFFFLAWCIHVYDGETLEANAQLCWVPFARRSKRKVVRLSS